MMMIETFRKKGQTGLEKSNKPEYGVMTKVQYYEVSEVMLQGEIKLGDDQNEMTLNLREERIAKIVENSKTAWYVINADNKKKLRWDLFIILLVLWNSI